MNRRLLVVPTISLGVLSLIPLILHFNNYYLLLASLILLYTTMVSAWNIIGGFAGQIDLAAGAYHGIGIFVTGLLFIFYRVTPWIGIFLGGAVAALLALMIGYPTFRFGLREVWYALTSLALVVILYKLFLVWESVGGPIERYLPKVGFSWFYLTFPNTYTYYYYMSALLLVATIFLNIRIRYSKLGYYLLAVRENEEAAEMLGIDIRRYKLYALMIYSFIVGLTGGIFVLMLGYVHPVLFDSWISIQTAMLGIVGGLGSIAGGPVIAVVLLAIAEYLRVRLGGYIPGLHQIMFAIILMAIVLFKPEGIGDWINTMWRKLSKGYEG
jgi:branched-chain amino acid transport system permease protein